MKIIGKNKQDFKWLQIIFKDLNDIFLFLLIKLFY
jgi:hypothetical protein